MTWTAVATWLLARGAWDDEGDWVDAATWREDALWEPIAEGADPFAEDDDA